LRTLVEKAAKDLVTSKYAIALTGAGISTESGIPDFRGPQGIWTRNPEAERKAYQSYQKFINDPKRYWEERLSEDRDHGWWGELERTQPNSGHYALAKLEKTGILKRILTQNVDGLHLKAGSRKIIEYHGSIFKLRCTSCVSRFKRETIDLRQLKREDKLPPRCPKCGGIIKGDGVSFGEPIPRDVYQQSINEVELCDVMLICGTSAVVTPFANLPRISRRREATIIIEVNLEPTPLTNSISDYLIQGKTGELLPKIVETIETIRQEQEQLL